MSHQVSEFHVHRNRLITPVTTVRSRFNDPSYQYWPPVVLIRRAAICIVCLFASIVTLSQCPMLHLDASTFRIEMKIWQQCYIIRFLLGIPTSYAWRLCNSLEQGVVEYFVVIQLVKKFLHINIDLRLLEENFASRTFLHSHKLLEKYFLFIIYLLFLIFSSIFLFQSLISLCSSTFLQFLGTYS
jgi:hypothetical protein